MFGNYDGFHMLWGGGVLMILFWATVIVVMLWGLRQIFATAQLRNDLPNAIKEMPEEIVKKRFARGEISREEYTELLKNLR